MASQNNSPSSQGKSTNHHSKSPKRPSKFNWEKGCQRVFNPKTQVHQMPNDFQKRYSESSYHEHSGYRDNASYLIRKQNKRALKRKMKDNPETGPSESKKQEKNPVEILNSSSTSKDSCLVPLINKEPQASDDFWHSSTPIPQYKCSNPTEHSQPQFNEWWVQHAQVSESPIGTDQALIIVQNQTYPISVQSMIQRSGLAQWLHNLNQLLLPRGSLNFINIQSPVGDFEIPQSARHESFFMHISSSAFESALCYLGGIPELLNVTESNPVDLLRAFAYLQCPKFPETYFVRFLPNLDTSTWAKFTFVHSFFMPDDTAIQTHLHNFNLWNVRMPSLDLSQSKSRKPRPFDFCRAARSSERAFKHWANMVHGGRCIKCTQPFTRSEIIRPTKYQNFYRTPCCDYYVHFQCWMIIAQEEDYKCPICGQFYQFGNIDKTVNAYNFENPLPYSRIHQRFYKF